ncbi:cysteine-rich KTR domain-containing protein [Lacrimispora sp. BS-2]|uniref:Cysteine-rich KTR domain-containing protein n=1 Tax=Lacrimispora sp. BS-2 TaxID=3151850 RepID=A0AAU7PUS1_9FIRM
MKEKQWVYCPICNNKTRMQIREDTVLKNFPLFCPKCKHEIVIDVWQFNIKIVNEQDAEPTTMRNHICSGKHELKTNILPDKLLL